TAPSAEELAELLEQIKVPTEHRMVQVQQAIWAGASAEQIVEATQIDPWFVDQVVLINEIATAIEKADALDKQIMTEAKRHG
ncbi:hypothetical protein QP248_10360, partial [Aerococcus sp. UMB8608]